MKHKSKVKSRLRRKSCEWAIPIHLSFGMHILLVLAVIFWPGMFVSRPVPLQIHTVTFISLSSQALDEVHMQGKPEVSSKKIEPAGQPEKGKSADMKKEGTILEKNPISIPPAIEGTKGNEHAVKASDRESIKNRSENAAVKKPSINQSIHELDEKQKQEQTAAKERQAEQLRRQQMAEAARAEQAAKKAANEAMISQKVRELEEKQKQEQIAAKERQAEQLRRQQMAEAARAEQAVKKAANEAMISQKVRELEEKQKQEQIAAKERRVEELRRQQIAESVSAEQEAKQAANEATNELKQLLRSSNSVSNGATDSQENEGRDKEIENKDNPVEKGYLAAISNRIQQFWALPEFAKWDPSLMATVVITINQDGKIISSSFQEHSTNKLFDQYVEKTLQQAAPLPPIPAALRKTQFEIGLVFKPTGLQKNR